MNNLIIFKSSDNFRHYFISSQLKNFNVANKNKKSMIFPPFNTLDPSSLPIYTDTYKIYIHIYIHIIYIRIYIYYILIIFGNKKSNEKILL